MKPIDVKERIKILKESLERNRALVRWHAKWIDPEYFKNKADEQQKIIDAATTRLDEITENRYNAVEEVGKIEQSDKHRRKELIQLKYARKIQKLKELAEKIRDARKSK